MDYADVLDQLAYLVISPVHAVAEFGLGGFYRLSDGGYIATQLFFRGYGFGTEFGLGGLH